MFGFHKSGLECVMFYLGIRKNEHFVILQTVSLISNRVGRFEFSITSCSNFNGQLHKLIKLMKKLQIYVPGT